MSTNGVVNYDDIDTLVVNDIIGFTIYVIAVAMCELASITLRKARAQKLVYLDINPAGDGFK